MSDPKPVRLLILGTGGMAGNHAESFAAIPGGLTVTGSTVVFNGYLTISGSHTLNAVEIRSGTVVIAAGTSHLSDGGTCAT